jgi:hypothetical protein
MAMGVDSAAYSVELGNNASQKANKWVAIVENTAIAQTNLVGIAITATGTCIALDSQGTPGELVLTDFPVGIYPIYPAKLKTGLTATAFALYSE